MYVYCDLLYQWVRYLFDCVVCSCTSGSYFRQVIYQYPRSFTTLRTFPLTRKLTILSAFFSFLSIYLLFSDHLFSSSRFSVFFFFVSLIFCDSLRASRIDLCYHMFISRSAIINHQIIHIENGAF